MNNIDYIVLAALILTNLVLLLEVLYFIIRRNTTNKLIQAAFEKNEDKFNSISDSFFGKFVSKFDKEYIKFNVALIQKDNKNIEKAITDIDNMNLSKGQKRRIYPKAFYYYIDHNKKQEAKNYYDKLSTINVYKEKKNVEMMYDTYILESHKHLDESLKKLNRVKKEELPQLEKAISKMYENKKINSEAKKYERLAQRHQAELEGITRKQ